MQDMTGDLTAPDGLVSVERQSSEDYPNIFYVRHAAMTASEGFIEEVCNDGKIVVHHADFRSIDPLDYDIDETNRYAKNDIRDLRDATDDGALIGVTYHMVGVKFTRVGVIEPGGDVEFVHRHYDDEERIYKVAELDDFVDVDFVECPVLFVARSRRGATISEFPIASKRAIRAIVDGSAVPRDVWSLSSGQFELLARRDIEARFDGFELRLPSGRTLKDIDIIGVDEEGSDIIAQVTLKKGQRKVEDKRDDLLSYSADERYLYLPQCLDDICDGYDVTPRPAEKVFSRLDREEEARKHISKMLDLSRMGSRFNR